MAPDAYKDERSTGSRCRDAMVSNLEIFVSQHCYGCEQASNIAEAVRSRYPDVEVRLVNVDREAPPPAVVAVPTYMLNGRIISLGNPSENELFEELEGAP